MSENFAIVAFSIYPNVPDSLLKKTCDYFKVPLVFAGAGERFRPELGRAKWLDKLRIGLKYLNILPHKKVILADYSDTFICADSSVFEARLPDNGVIVSTEYAKVPYLALTAEAPLWPRNSEDFIRCFKDKNSNLIFSPNSGAYGGNRLDVIRLLEHLHNYISSDDQFPEDQYMLQKLFYEKYLYEQANEKFWLDISLDKNKQIFTSCQPNVDNGKAIFYHFPGLFHLAPENRDFKGGYARQVLSDVLGDNF